MAKKAKKTQTAYTTGGYDISNTAIPLYQSNLTRMDSYLSDPTSTIDDYLNKYYSNTSAQSDFLRNYNRAMSGTTANNYSATSGGYSSSGQQAYNDMQRYQNDLASRLQDYGVSSASTMANNYYNNLLKANNAYGNAYSLGEEYSDIEQYNNAIDQANSNWWSPLMSVTGGVLSAIPFQVTQALGTGLSALGSATATDISDTTEDTRGQGAGNVDSYTNLGTGIGSMLSSTNWAKKLLNNNSNNTTGLFGNNTNSSNIWGNYQSSTSPYFRLGQ